MEGTSGRFGGAEQPMSVKVPKCTTLEMCSSVAPLGAGPSRAILIWRERVKLLIHGSGETLGHRPCQKNT